MSCCGRRFFHDFHCLPSSSVIFHHLRTSWVTEPKIFQACQSLAEEFYRSHGAKESSKTDLGTVKQHFSVQLLQFTWFLRCTGVLFALACVCVIPAGQTWAAQLKANPFFPYVFLSCSFHVVHPTASRRRKGLCSWHDGSLPPGLRPLPELLKDASPEKNLAIGAATF